MNSSLTAVFEFFFCVFVRCVHPPRRVRALLPVCVFCVCVAGAVTMIVLISVL